MIVMIMMMMIVTKYRETQTQHGCGKFQMLSVPCVYQFGAYAVCCLFGLGLPVQSSSFIVTESTEIVSGIPDHNMNKQQEQ